jgi:hypothetical protein
LCFAGFLAIVTCPDVTPLMQQLNRQVCKEISFLLHLLVLMFALFFVFVYRAVLSSWEDEWTNSEGKNLRLVKPSVQA